MRKDVIGFEGLYTVDDSGNVFSLRKRKELKPVVFPSGYVYVHLCNGKRSKCVRLHRLVAEHFIPNPENYRQVNHINGNKTDNRAENLEWCDNLYNMKHAQENGLFIVDGENNPSAKLSWKDVYEIRKQYIRKSRVYGANALAKKYRVTNVMIGKIVRGECWKENSLHRAEGDI